MRKLLITICMAVLTALVFILLSGQFFSKNTPIPPAVTDLSEEEVEAVEQSADPVPAKFRGSVLYQKDDMTWTYDYTVFAEDDDLINSSGIVLYKDTLPVDTFRVIGTGRYFAEGGKLKFAIGVDTVNYDFNQLPPVMDPANELLPPGTVSHAYKNSFELSDSSFTCSFEFEANLPPSPPSWLKQFISTTIRNDLQAMFVDNKGADRIYKEHMNIPSHPRKIRGFDASSSSPEQIADHYFAEFKRLYCRQFDTTGPRYDYSFSVWPAWESKDKRFATYRFYTYYYTMGMHGFMEEYYLTFDNHNGRILGYDEIFAPEGKADALAKLEVALNRKKNQAHDIPAKFHPGISEEDLSSNAWMIVKEKIDSLYYPRPAVTQRGVVFSYQPYEMGGFYEGVIHILISPDQRFEARFR